MIAAASHTQNSARIFKLCRIKQQFGIKNKKRLTSLVTLPGTGADRRRRNSSYHKNHNWWRWERQKGNEVQNSIGQQGRGEIKVRPCLSINVGSGQVRQSFYNFRSKESEKWIDRQVSAPNGYISTTSPITIKKIVIKKETVNDQKPEEPSKTEARTETSTATVKIQQPAGGRTARIKINVVRSPGLTGTDNKENQMKK